MIDSDTLARHSALAQRIASEGMVLLENREHMLPLKPGCRVAFFGRGQLDFSQGGSGAAAVRSRLQDTLEELVGRTGCPIRADRELLERYRNDPSFLPDTGYLVDVASRCDAACLILSRNAGEGTDRKDEPGDFRLSAKEGALVELLAGSPFRKVAVVVNSGGLVELGWFRRHDNFKALLLAWQPGMCGLRALIDVLSGEAEPAGRLADTIAETCADWPSTEGFQRYRHRLEYNEDVYVGYRYFETLPGKSVAVLYPFGYGLSYTSFSIRIAFFDRKDGIVTIGGTVANIGMRSGREVVQCYMAAPGTDRPALELCAFCKTGTIRAGEQEDFLLKVPMREQRRFDDTGSVCGRPGSFVLESGTYRFFVGSSVRELSEAGAFAVPETVILETPGNVFLPQPAERLRADGTSAKSGVSFAEDEEGETEKTPSRTTERISLDTVSVGRCTLKEFVGLLTPEELVGLCHGQPPARPNCTGGVGNLPRYGIPTLQTADGPVGIRCGCRTSCFPCATMAACTWDMELIREMGAAIAAEGKALGLDILLAPGLNIHRNPLNGRNFEYYSEDPLLSGKCAAAFVKGVQSSGMIATVKHFACNSRENFRRLCDSIVSERALREIYLRGFEIAVKEGRPGCVMSSYNLINGTHASTNYALLTQVLRREWGFDGVVMTDWMTTEPLWKELSAGNDLKMPCVAKCEAAYTARLEVDMDRVPVVSRRTMEISAMRILSLIMNSGRFREHLPRQETPISPSGERLGADRVAALSHSGIGIAPSTDPDFPGTMLCNLKQNYWKTETALFYRLRFAKAGRYAFRFRVATPSDTLTLHVMLDGKVIGDLPIRATGPHSSRRNEWSTQGGLIAEICGGSSELKVIFDDPVQVGCALSFVEIIPVEGRRSLT